MSSCSGPARMLFVVAAFLAALLPSSAFSSGFALIEQGVSGLGNAYSGGSAIAEDATTVFFNPAGLIRLEGQQAVVAGHVIIPTADFTNNGSTQVLQPRTGIPLLGGNSDGGESAFVPNAYYSIRISPRLAAGIGINAPFGLGTKYDDGWVGRYHALESNVMTVNINPSIAYRIGDHLTVGGGFSIQYIKAKLTNAVDFGTLDALGAFRAFGLAPGALGLTPQLSDGSARLDGDSWAFGWNAGFLYEFTPATRLGVHYRSSIKHELDGDAEFYSVPTGLAPYPVFKNTGAQAVIRLPESLSVSFVHSFNPQWTVMADLTWTNWRHFKELRIEFDNPFQADSVTTENWENSYRYSVGVTFKPTEQWALRAGLAHDTTPVSSENFRTPRIPDGSRTWIALGAGYRLSKLLSFDLGYAYIFVNDPTINKNPVGEDAVRGGLKGVYDADINIISAQLNMNF